MRSEAVIREVREGDAEQLAAVMRDADAAEVRAGGHEPLECLRMSIGLSQQSFAVELGGELAALGGVVPGPRPSFLGPTEYDIPWLLTGRAVDRHRGAFWCASKTVLDELRRRHPDLRQMVDARYAAAIRWVHHLGGEVQPAKPWGVNGEPFHPVVWRA